MRTEQALREFIASRIAANLSPATIQWYKDRLLPFSRSCPTLPRRPEPVECFLAEVQGSPETKYDVYRALKTFFKFMSSRRRLLMRPSTVYLVEQTIKRLGEVRVVKHIEDAGLFVARLNNSDWITGKASYIYQLDITQNHYADPNLSISADLATAVEAAMTKLRRCSNDNAD